MYVDAHNHLLNVVPPEQRTELCAAALAAGIGLMLVNSVNADDWLPLSALAAVRREIFPFYGIHPWQTPPAATWDEPLARLLPARPNNVPPVCGIGETGLDRKKSPLPLAQQQEMLSRHLALAWDRKLPLTLHCLDAAPELFAMLYPRFDGRPVLLHSFSGDCRWAAKFLAKGAFFSFSGVIFHPRRRRARELFHYIPADRLLLETDAPDMLPPPELWADKMAAAPSRPPNTPLNLPGIYQAAATARQTTVAALAAQTASNVRAFLGSDAFPASGRMPGNAGEDFH